MSCVIFNSAAPAEARPLMAAMTRQREVEFFICSVARETSLDIASRHHQKLSHLLFLAERESDRLVFKGSILGAAFGPRPADSIFGIMSDSLRILVVEDEKAVGHMIAMVLGGPAAKVARARNGWEALIKIGVVARPFDVVITDHRMPRMTGLELVRRLRAQDFSGKILVLSAHLSDEVIRGYEELSVDMMMTKPFDFDELQEAMAILNRKPSVLAGASNY